MNRIYLWFVQSSSFKLQLQMTITCKKNKFDHDTDPEDADPEKKIYNICNTKYLFE